MTEEGQLGARGPGPGPGAGEAQTDGPLVEDAHLRGEDEEEDGALPEVAETTETEEMTVAEVDHRGEAAIDGQAMAEGGLPPAARLRDTLAVAAPLKETRGADPGPAPLRLTVLTAVPLLLPRLRPALAREANASKRQPNEVHSRSCRVFPSSLSKN